MPRFGVDEEEEDGVSVYRITREENTRFEDVQTHCLGFRLMMGFDLMPQHIQWQIFTLSH